MSAQVLALLRVFAETVRNGTPLLFGTTGEITTQKSGSLNLGVEGIMAVGAIFGYLAAATAGSLLLGIICAFIGAALCGLLFAFLTITLQANQNVTGLALTIFGTGLCRFIGQSMKTKGTFPAMSSSLQSALILDTGIPFLRDIPFVGQLLFSYNPLVYLSIFIAILAWVYLKYTKAGLRMRAIGENPAAADSVGVSITRVKYMSIITGAGISGLGGLYMAMVINNGSWSDNWIGGYGWISIALVIFASWSPAKAIFGSLLFGFFLALRSNFVILVRTFPSVFGWMAMLPPEFYQALPFVVTAVVLVISSIRKNKEGVQPSAIGLNYYREDR
ncbi:MAG: ABC transporter permease [Clostridia bacterium]